MVRPPSRRPAFRSNFNALSTVCIGKCHGHRDKRQHQERNGRRETDQRLSGSPRDKLLLWSVRDEEEGAVISGTDKGRARRLRSQLESLFQQLQLGRHGHGPPLQMVFPQAALMEILTLPHQLLNPCRDLPSSNGIGDHQRLGLPHQSVAPGVGLFRI